MTLTGGWGREKAEIICLVCHTFLVLQGTDSW